MATLEEAADAFAKDLTTQNIAGLMLAFTPEGMMKAMALQGQMQARTAQAMAQGRTPAPVTSYSLDVKGAEGDDQVVHLTTRSDDGSAEIQIRWREVEGVWKVNDLSLVELRDASGATVDPNAPAT